MRLKIVLVILLVMLIAGLLVLTPVGNNIFGVGSISLPGLSSLINFGSQERFQMQLVANKDAFAGKAFEVTNTTVYVKGLCVGSVYVFGANIAKEGRCDISVENAKGKVEYSSIGTVEAAIEGGQVALDGSFISPANDRKVRFSIVPNELFISNYNSNGVSLAAVTGEIRKFKSDGSQDQLKILTNEKVEILGYIGNARLINNDMVLSGFASKVNWFS